jgi:hypothetical protein
VVLTTLLQLRFSTLPHTFFSQGTPMGELGQMLESTSSNRGLVNMPRSFTR